MGENQINIAPVFALPFATTELADAAALNTELAELLLAREQDRYASQPRSPYLRAGVFESVSGILQWQEPCIEKLRGALIGTISRLVAELGGFSAQELANLGVVNQTRFNVTRHGGGALPHIDPMASWSAVYCVQPGDETPEHPESGTLHVLDPRLSTNTYLDPANVRLRSPFGLGHISIRPRAGQLVIFPAHLVREVATYFGAQPRITVHTTFSFGVRPAQAQSAAPPASTAQA